MSRSILILNAGSSSLKCAIHRLDDLSLIAKAQVAGLGIAPRFESDSSSSPRPDLQSMPEALAAILDWIDDHGGAPKDLAGIGHRVVHGGTKYVKPTLVGDRVLNDLDGLRALAPLHLPFGLGVLRDMRRLRPHLSHIACFDTAFHATQGALATRLPLPRSYFERGYRRYGFHGLNYEHVVDALPRLTGSPLPRRMLVAHLGSGASMCAILDGRSVGTTMGFSTADGLVMGTRTGSIDPGVLVALMRDENLTLDQLEDLLYRRSGLLGLSGISSDMKTLLDSSEPEAAEAVDYYCYSAARHAASLVPALGGLDSIVFTGGVGENAGQVRSRILAHLKWLNVPPEHIHIIPANEELAMARHVKALVSN